jgi:hypothetical protein
MNQLHEHVATVNGVELRWNVSGVKEDGRVDLDDFKVHLFVVDYKAGKGGFDAPLSATEVAKLYDFLQPFREHLGDASASGTSQLRVVEVGDVIDSLLELLEAEDDATLSEIINALRQAGKLKWVADNLGRVQSEELEAALRHSRRRTALEHLEQLVEEDSKDDGDVVRLSKEREELADYSAGKPETVFQRWFEVNTWVLGREYIRRHPLRKVGIDSEADLVLETTDGFLDLVELKRPKAQTLAVKAGSNPSAAFHYPHSELAQAYGQCVRYMGELEKFRSQLEEKYKARIVAPRVFLVIGRSSADDQTGTEALRRTAATFHNIEVLTYDQILDIGRALLATDDSPFASDDPND